MKFENGRAQVFDRSLISSSRKKTQPGFDILLDTIKERGRERWMACGDLGEQAQQSLWMQISGMLKAGVRLAPAGFLALCGIA